MKDKKNFDFIACSILLLIYVFRYIQLNFLFEYYEQAKNMYLSIAKYSTCVIKICIWYTQGGLTFEIFPTSVQ